MLASIRATYFYVYSGEQKISVYALFLKVLEINSKMFYVLCKVVIKIKIKWTRADSVSQNCRISCLMKVQMSVLEFDRAYDVR